MFGFFRKVIYARTVQDYLAMEIGLDIDKNRVPGLPNSFAQNLIARNFGSHSPQETAVEIAIACMNALSTGDFEQRKDGYNIYLLAGVFNNVAARDGAISESRLKQYEDAFYRYRQANPPGSDEALMPRV